MKKTDLLMPSSTARLHACSAPLSVAARRRSKTSFTGTARRCDRRRIDLGTAGQLPGAHSQQQSRFDGSPIDFRSRSHPNDQADDSHCRLGPPWFPVRTQPGCEWPLRFPPHLQGCKREWRNRKRVSRDSRFDRSTAGQRQGHFATTFAGLQSSIHRSLCSGQFRWFRKSSAVIWRAVRRTHH